MTEHTESTQSLPGETRESPADLLSRFAEAIPLPVVLLAPDTRIRYANTVLLQTLGLGKERYLHKKLPGHWLMHRQEGLSQLRELLHAVQPGANPEPMPLSLRSSDGSEILTEVHARPLPSLSQGLDSLMVVTFKHAGPPETRPRTDQSGKDANWRSLRDELERSEERLRMLFEYAPDAYYLCDLKGRFVDGNKAAERIVGYKREELIGKSFLKLNLLSKRQLPKAARALARNALGKPTGPDEFTLRRKDGSTIAVEISTYPVEIQGRVLVLGIARDIAERKQAQAKLQESEAKYRQLHESSRDGCVAVDLNGRILESNTAFREMLGYTEKQLTRLTYEDVTPHKWHAIEAKIIKEQVLIRGYSDLYEKEYIRRDGLLFPIELRAYLKKDQEGRPTGMWGIVRDITKRKQAEEAVLREKAFSDSVINTLPGIFYMLDEQGRYVWWNKNMEDVTEYASSEMPHIHSMNFFEGTDKEHIKQAIAMAFREGKTAVEADVVAKSGWKTPYYFTGVRVERDGKPYLAGLGIDITERRRAQAVLEKLNADLESSVQELERSNNELRDFAHITAHDLKAPLRGIATLADWLDQDYGQQIGPEGQENLHLLRGRVDRMGHLINGILRYSEIRHGDQPVETLDTHALVEEVIEHIAPPDHIEIHIENTLPPVEAERTRLTQILQNLITNAVKYIDKPQGTITISARDDGDFWEFRIADNGPGIEAQHFARIFQMFQTLSPTETSDSTGLGLAVVKKIVDLYGGRVWIESEINQGSTFFFTLPKQQKGAVRGKD